MVSARALFGSCLYVVEDLLPRFGVASTLRRRHRPRAMARGGAAGDEGVLPGKPVEPDAGDHDIKAVAEIAHEAGAKLVVDNVFATPVLQRRWRLGADVVVYSATKHIDGQGRCAGRRDLRHEEFIARASHNFLRQTGPAMSPFNAWVMLKGLETLPLRVAQQTASAAEIAEFLAEEQAVGRVLYPFRADHPQARSARRANVGRRHAGELRYRGRQGRQRSAFANALDVIKISNNLGDAKSLITHPATTTHQRLTPEARASLGIGDGLLRLSVGLEDAEDLVDDLSRGLWAAARA